MRPDTNAGGRSDNGWSVAARGASLWATGHEMDKQVRLSREVADAVQIAQVHADRFSLPPPVWRPRTRHVRWFAVAALAIGGALLYLRDVQPEIEPVSNVDRQGASNATLAPYVLAASPRLRIDRAGPLFNFEIEGAGLRQSIREFGKASNSTVWGIDRIDDREQVWLIADGLARAEGWMRLLGDRRGVMIACGEPACDVWLVDPATADASVGTSQSKPLVSAVQEPYLDAQESSERD